MTRPVVLISVKENMDNVKFLMNELIYPQPSTVNVRIIRSLFDSKMSATLSGLGELIASCALLTTL